MRRLSLVDQYRTNLRSRGFPEDRDLNLESILLDERGFAQIEDPGSRRFCDASLMPVAKVGIPLYMAPEMYDEACDYITPVHSFALCVDEIFVGQPVFPLMLAPTVLMKKFVIDNRLSLPADMHAAVKTIAKR
jgi:hypothetical protein